jgi:hypothetical protein
MSRPRTHPGPGAYNGGCRCDECKEAHRLRCAAVKAALAARPREDVPHGTDSGYTNWACRCALCCKVNSDRSRAYRKSVKERNEQGAG